MASNSYSVCMGIYARMYSYKAGCYKCKLNTRAAVNGTPLQIPTFLPLAFTLGSRSHKTLSSTLYIMSPMHLQCLKLLCPTVKERMDLQENTLYVWPWPSGHGHIKCCQYPLHQMTYAPAKFEVATSNSLGEDTVTRNVIDGQMHRRRTNFGTKLIYPFF